MHVLARWPGLFRPDAHAPAHAFDAPRAPRRPARLSARLSGLLLCWLILAGPAAAEAEAPPLIFGVFPNMTAKQIIEAYRPLADELEKHLHRRVLVYSARDFRTFAARSRQGEYDILLTAPHLAWLARQEAGYRPLLKYSQPVRGLLVVRADSGVKSLAALRGRTLATADPVAIVVLALQADLAAKGLRHDVDYRTTNYATHTNAAMQVIHGRVDAAMVGVHPYKLMQPELRQQLRVLAETPPLSSLMYLIHPRLRDAEAEAVRQALLNYAATPGGQAFMRQGSYGGFSDVSGNEFLAFRPYAQQAQKMLQATP